MTAPEKMEKLMTILALTVSANDLIYGKPHPLVYLECVRLLDELLLGDCIAFEDSITGLIAAKAANIFSLAVPEPANFNNPRFQIADRVLTSLEAFHLELLND